MALKSVSAAAGIVVAGLLLSPAIGQGAEKPAQDSPGKAETFGKQLGKKVDSALGQFDFKRAFEDVRGDIKRLSDKVIGATGKFRDIEADTYLVATGSANPLPGGTGDFIGCSSIGSWAKNKCPSARIFLKEHYKKDGPACAQVVSTVTCIKR